MTFGIDIITPYRPSQFLACWFCGEKGLKILSTISLRRYRYLYNYQILSASFLGDKNRWVYSFRFREANFFSFTVKLTRFVVKFKTTHLNVGIVYP
jgi:hypothetical protein